VPDITPYGMMKVRLLNASHSALGYLGYLAGYRTTDEVMGYPLFRGFVVRMMDDEVTPLLPAVPGIDLADYKRTLVERFANPKISDQLERLCARGSSKLTRFLVPSITDAVEHGRPHALLDLAVAGWLRYLRGVDPEGNEIEVKDPRKDDLQPLAVAGGSNPRPLLQRERDVFGDLARNEAFVASVEQALYSLDRLGPRETLAA
jgi:mannitol 2-dehydrogenase